MEPQATSNTSFGRKGSCAVLEGNSCAVAGRSKSRAKQVHRGSIYNAATKEVPSDYIDWLKALQEFNKLQIANLTDEICEVNKQLGCEEDEDLTYELCLDSDDSDEESTSDEAGIGATQRINADEYNGKEEASNDSPRYLRRNILKINYAEEADSDSDDDFLYCNACGVQMKEMCCPIHLAYVVENKKVPEDGSVPDRASHTVPDNLSICTSNIKGAGMGVWTEVDIEKGTIFGPYDGIIEFDRKTADESGYSWKIIKSGSPQYYIDGEDLSRSNWLRYVNCSPVVGKENLIAFQYKGNIFYRTAADILMFCELLIWYGDDYAKDLGISLQEVKLQRCSMCGMLFSSATHLQNHQRIHHPCFDQEKKWRCNHCAYSTNINTNFCHHQLVHTKEKPFKCAECGKGFSQKHHLQDHLFTHTREKPHKCNICGKSFSQTGNLKSHQLIHSGQKPHVCEECGEAFARSTNLHRHRLIHTGQKPFKCPHCPSRFRQNSTMKRHIERLHTKQI